MESVGLEDCERLAVGGGLEVGSQGEWWGGKEILDFGLRILDWGKKSALFALPGLGDAVETYESWGWRVSGEWVMG